jgi:predicted DNA-binding transcriptional regulator AlpA
MSQTISPIRAGSLPFGVMPRGLSRAQAAEYIGMSPTKFDELVGDGQMPKPARCGRRLLWDRRQINRALDALFNEEGGH